MAHGLFAQLWQFVGGGIRSTLSVIERGLWILATGETNLSEENALTGGIWNRLVRMGWMPCSVIGE
jgi:hypothetical protein